MWKYRLKEFFLKPYGAALTSSIIVLGVCLAIFLPIVSSSNDDSTGDIVAYNRDSNSGTREAFEEAMNIESDEKFSRNVIEVNNSSSMIDQVEINEKGIGYASASELYDYSKDNGEGDVRDEYIDILIPLELETIPPKKTYILDGTYKAKRDFNVFFRINEDEASLWDFDSSTGIFTVDNDGTDSEKVGWALYNYLLHSEQAADITALIVPSQEPRIDFNTEVDWNSLNLEYKDYSGEEFFTVGSTSVVDSLLKLIVNDPTFNPDYYQISFEQVMNNAGFENIQINNSHSGSGDAFNTNIEGMLGFQSRLPKNEEAEKWGYSDVTTMVNDNVYSPYEIDAIVMFVNIDNPYYSQSGILHNITTGIVNLIYTKGTLDWVDLNDLL